MSYGIYLVEFLKSGEPNKAVTVTAANIREAMNMAQRFVDNFPQLNGHFYEVTKAGYNQIITLKDRLI